MLIQRNNPLGGRRLKDNSFPLHEDRAGNFGLLIGYDKDGDKMLIPLRDAQNFASQFGVSLSEYKRLLKTTAPKIPLTHRIACYLLGKRTYYKIMNEGFEEGD